MSIYGMMVVKNESGRYLQSVLNNLLSCVDGVFVYDDASEDETVQTALDCGAIVLARHENSFSFQQDEGSFREQALEAMIEKLSLRDGDWVLSLDADEYPSNGEGSFNKSHLESLIYESDGRAIQFTIPEVFGISDNGNPLIRVDGFWKDIKGVRLFPYNANYTTFKKGLASGSVPEHYLKDPFEAINSVILHYGYLDQADRVKKYARYFGAPGHSVKHVDSILRQGRFTEWPDEGMKI